MKELRNVEADLRQFRLRALVATVAVIIAFVLIWTRAYYLQVVQYETLNEQAERNRTAISAQGVSVWLCAELDLLWDRVRHKATRPLLRTADPKRTLAELCEKREPFYAMADLKVHTLPHYSIDETSDKVIEALLRRPDILEGA